MEEKSNIKTCYGDLIIMINALMDYASLLDMAVKDWHLEGFHAASYRYHAERCRKISRQYALAIGYDYFASWQLPPLFSRAG